MLRLLMALLLVASAGCAKSGVAKARLSQRQWEQDSGAILRRAAFEMSCSPEDIELEVLKTSGAGGRVNTVGAVGCGHRFVYLTVDHGKTWALDSADSQPRQ